MGHRALRDMEQAAEIDTDDLVPGLVGKIGDPDSNTQAPGRGRKGSNASALRGTHRHPIASPRRGNRWRQDRGVVPPHIAPAPRSIRIPSNRTRIPTPTSWAYR